MSGLVESSADARSKTIGQNFRVRAWVSFSGDSGSPGTGQANGNVSGVTRHSTGFYTVTFATAMEDANYTFCGAVTNPQSPPHGRILVMDANNKNSGSVKFGIKSDNNTSVNEANVTIAIIR